MQPDHAEDGAVAASQRHQNRLALVTRDLADRATQRAMDHVEGHLGAARSASVISCAEWRAAR